ncbi:MAG: hypothetical protein Q7T61_04225 [Caulobacter sp.]|nr:hypothetical protein [Caulobacter sp.]
MLLPIVAAFEWLAVIVNGPMDTDRLLTQALGYCRQAGDGEATALVKARALRNGWQEVWEDTSGLDTFEVVEREIEWRRFDRGRLRSIHVTFYDNPDQDGWRGVCGVEVDGFPKDSTAISAWPGPSPGASGLWLGPTDGIASRSRPWTLAIGLNGSATGNGASTSAASAMKRTPRPA